MATTKPAATSKTTRKVQVPGGAPAADQATQAEDATSKTTEVVDTGAADAGAETNTEAAGNGLDWSEGAAADDTATAGEAAVYVEHDIPGELPDADDIDPTKITRAVLTQQGWVMPGLPAVKA